MTSIQFTETKYMLTVNEASKMLNVSIHTVYRLIEQNKLKCKKMSVRKTMIPAEEIERYINEH
ncbi:MAG: helix-turn-helix domain-containing protein [Oscillospiraceae bacterium]|nr:helix-turn-helix domain-containing protein [Oscillospiraceae bacterium]MDD6085873.1 helix-turn-helix domain-containing protein [Oscillospiraceae bacterium]